MAAAHAEKPVTVQNGDMEGAGGYGTGAPLGRQLSIQLTSEQFEKLYLQPGGTAAKGDLAKRLGNPTPIGLASFLLCLFPVSMAFMQFGNSDATSAVVLSGVYYLIGGIGLTLAGIFEFILGNTFPSLVFITFGGFWFAFGFIEQPMQNLTAAYTNGAASPAYNSGLMLYLITWGLIVFVYLIASLRTNLVFVILFFVLDLAFWLLVAGYSALSRGSAALGVNCIKAAGAFAFVTCLCGWYLFVVLTFGSTGMPISLPVGDMSNFMSGKKKAA